MSLVAVSAIVAGCTDPVGVSPSTARLRGSDQLQGDLNASPPLVGYTVEGDLVQICATWSAGELQPGTRLTFAFHLLGPDGTWAPLGIAEVNHHAAPGCISRGDLGEGKHTVRVVGTAMRQGGPNVELVTTGPAEVEILVGYSIEVAPATAAILAGETQQFVASVYFNGQEVTENLPPLTWTSSDNSIATVDANGLAAGVGNGVATIQVALTDKPAVRAEATLTVTKVVDPITSPFDTDGEGWTSFGDPATVFSYQSAGGNPGGHLQLIEGAQGTADYFIAPSKFLGDVRAFYGGTLSYDLRVDNISRATFADDEVILTGGGLTLFFSTPNPTAALVWEGVTIGLNDTAGWHVGSAAGPLATADQIRTVLGSLTGLRIRADYRAGSEIVDLDNVVLAP